MYATVAQKYSPYSTIYAEIMHLQACKLNKLDTEHQERAKSNEDEKNVDISVLEPEDTQVKSHCRFENPLAIVSFTVQLPRAFQAIYPRNTPSELRQKSRPDPPLRISFQSLPLG